MDSVRFGRALGGGVREAAKAALKAAEAASSPSPAGPSTSLPGSRPRIVEQVQQVRPSAQNLRQGGKHFGRAVWKPFARLSTVLWHEVIGVLFSLFAVVCGLEAWHGRASIQKDPGRTHEWIALGLFAVFTFFTASSFRKASQRQRR